MSSGHDPIPVFLNVDIEPDAEWLDPAAPSAFTGYEAMHRRLTELRPVLQERTGSPVRYSWCVRMDPQIAEAYGSLTWVAERYGSLIEESARAGDEIGLHPHWNRWDAHRRQWMLDLTDQAWIEDCLLRTLEAFASAFGRRCRTVHLGPFVNDRLLQLAERLGVRFELSLTPDQPRVRKFLVAGDRRGYLPSHVRVPRHPYRPARADFRRTDPADRLELTMIPLTVGPRAVTWSPRGVAARVRYVLARGLRGWRPMTPLYLTEPGAPPNSFAELFHRTLETDVTHLAFVINSTVRLDRLESFERALRVLLAHPAHTRFVFTTPPAAFPAAASGSPTRC